MKISIITAVFNAEDTILDTLKSVQSQTYENIEHIIQDGGSTDSTLEIIRANCTDKMSIVSAGDCGIYDAINKGINRAQGDIIGVLHSDDFFASPEVIARVANRLKNFRSDGVYGDLQYVAARDTSRVIRHWSAGRYDSKQLNWGWMPPHPTVYLRRHVFEQYGCYDTRYEISADYDAMLRFLQGDKVQLEYLAEVMVKMRIGGISNKSFKLIARKSFEDYLILRRHGAGGLFTLLAKNFSKLSQFTK